MRSRHVLWLFFQKETRRLSSSCHLSSLCANDQKAYPNLTSWEYLEESSVELGRERISIQLKDPFFKKKKSCVFFCLCFVLCFWFFHFLIFFSFSFSFLFFFSLFLLSLLPRALQWLWQETQPEATFRSLAYCYSPKRKSHSPATTSDDISSWKQRTHDDVIANIFTLVRTTSIDRRTGADSPDLEGR